MGVNELLNLVNKKIENLKQEEEERTIQIQKIQQIYDFLLGIKKEPSVLYSLGDDKLRYVVDLLSLDGKYLEKLSRNKIIYEAFTKFGRTAVPQIALLEEESTNLQEIIDTKIRSLDAEKEEFEKSESSSIEYEKLKEEIMDEHTPITSLLLINALLVEYKIEFLDQLNIKLSINDKNARVYQEKQEKLKREEQKEIIVAEAIEKDENNLSEVEQLSEKIENNFTHNERVNLQLMADGVVDCKFKEELDAFLEEWKYAFGDRPWDTVIEGVIELKVIEKLTTLEIVGDEVKEYSDELSDLDNQIALLNDYYDDMFLESVEIRETTPVQGLSKLDNALQRYTDDVLSTPIVVLYLNDALDKDIRSIADNETLADVFILIEQLKYDEAEYTCKFTNAKNHKDLYESKPLSKGKQARVIYTKLSDNIYGLISVTGKKADYPKSWKTMIEQRRKNCNVDSLREDIKDKHVLDGYVNMTQNISNKLYEMVSGIGTSKKRNATKKI